MLFLSSFHILILELHRRVVCLLFKKEQHIQGEGWTPPKVHKIIYTLNPHTREHDQLKGQKPPIGGASLGLRSQLNTTCGPHQPLEQELPTPEVELHRTRKCFCASVAPTKMNRELNPFLKSLGRVTVALHHQAQKWLEELGCGTMPSLSVLRSHTQNSMDNTQ